MTRVIDYFLFAAHDVRGSNIKVVFKEKQKNQLKPIVNAVAILLAVIENV